MNFRSTGYGRRFWEAGFGQWGLKMQDDISDGVAWLVKQGIADPKRVGIYGASYGGYATLAGVAFTPDLYAAAVDYVGVSNLFTFMQTIPPYWKPMLAKMQDMVGDPVRDKDRLAATSPALHADRIKTPLFVAQGAKDPRVNKDESDQMVKALKARGVNVEYMVKDNEGHGFHNDENKFEFYEAMEKFLLQHLAVVAFDPAGLAATAALAASAPPCAVQSQVAAAPKPTEPPVSTRSRPVPWRGTTPRRRGPGCRPPYRRAGRRQAAADGHPDLAIHGMQRRVAQRIARAAPAPTRWRARSRTSATRIPRRPGGRSGRWRAPRAAPPAQNVAAPGRRWRDHGGH